MKHFSHIDGDVILQNLQKVLDSRTFCRSGRLRTFLDYVVRKEQSGLSHQLKGYAIGVDVFSRSDSFDPGGDPLVRVQAGKLRKLLDQYYGSEGDTDPVRILIPRGTYVPAYEWKNPIIVPEVGRPRERPATNSEAFPPAEIRPPRLWNRYRFLALAIAAITVVNLSALGIQTATLLAGPRAPSETQDPLHHRELSALPQVTVRANLPQSSRLAPLTSAVEAAIRQMNSVELAEEGNRERNVPQQDPRLDFIVSLAITTTPERVAVVLYQKATGKFLFARNYASAATPTDLIYQANSFVEETLSFGGKLYRFAQSQGISSPLMGCMITTTQYLHKGTRESFLRAAECQQGLAADSNPSAFVTDLRSLRDFARRSDLERAMAAPEAEPVEMPAI